ncbi:MAG TPA: bacillithiol system redox-active protein YtxJ [Flavobacteriaceae bacterium]|jgi:bacillithiol system protein YtxJ|nr:bacillithiol system redox-active protein YtxJ [Flavobacteriaceae bacterium]HBS12466.1 bacillithiol system redox-active protein YtxJ [Flavobacteriaceae bacterium]
MGLFNTIFGATPNDSSSKLNWNPLSELDQLDTIIENSKTKTQVIFKHSTRCGISRAVLKQFEKKTIDDTTIDLYYLDLLNYRTISNELASKFNVQHQSPQLLVVKNEKVIAHDSHYDLLNVEME